MIGVFLLIIGRCGLKRIIIEYVTPVIRDELAGEAADFNLVTKSEVRRIGGFAKSYQGRFNGWNDYFFYKNVQMSAEKMRRQMR